MALTTAEKMIQTKRLNTLLKTVIQDALVAGLPVNVKDIDPCIKINNRTTSIGLCKYSEKKNEYPWTIFFSSYFFSIPDSKIKNTLMHELIHTLPNCFNHQTDFKHYMYRVNAKTNLSMVYHIGVKNNDEEISKLCNKKREEKFGINNMVTLTCECGCEIRIKKTRKAAKHPEQYKCKKHGLTLKLKK